MPVVDLAFHLVGRTIPLDHAYSLFSALNGIVRELHGNPRVGVHRIQGIRTAPQLLTLNEHSRLRLRLPSEEIASFLKFAGKLLEIDGHRVRVGIPSVETLTPASQLASRLVTFNNAVEPEAALADAQRDLQALGIQASPSLVPSSGLVRPGDPTRRIVRIKGRKIVGFAVRIAGLTAEESLVLQEKGLGGRRHFGCGVFLPFKEVRPS